MNTVPAGAPYLRIIGFSTVLNTGLNYLLIFGHLGFPAMRVAGAALATLLARMLEFLICVVCSLRSKTVPLDPGCFLRPGWEMTHRFVKYASPVVLNEAAWGLDNSPLTVILGYTDHSAEMQAESLSRPPVRLAHQQRQMDQRPDKEA